MRVPAFHRLAARSIELFSVLSHLRVVTNINFSYQVRLKATDEGLLRFERASTLHHVRLKSFVKLYAVDAIVDVLVVASSRAGVFSQHLVPTFDELIVHVSTRLGVIDHIASKFVSLLSHSLSSLFLSRARERARRLASSRLLGPSL